MKLNKILENCSTKYFLKKNHLNPEIYGIAVHSSKVKKKFLFGAIKGNKFNGENYIQTLIQKNKNFFIVHNSFDTTKFDLKKNIFIKTNNVRLLVSEVASVLFPNNIKEKIAVTGTNGKTSIANYSLQLNRIVGERMASIGTLGTIFNDEKIENTEQLTTPQSIEFHKSLKNLSVKGCKKLIVEASSIGLDQNRLHPIKFNKVAFTNLSHDHLDYHKSLTKYKIAKTKLFSEHTTSNSIAIINADDKYTKYFLTICKERKIKVLDYGFKGNFIKFKSIKDQKNGFLINFTFNQKDFELYLNCSSSFEIFNLFASLIITFEEKLNSNKFNLLNDLKNTDGRLEKIYDKTFSVFIDYAHTPDAVQNVLSCLLKKKSNRIISIIGCGGNRDKKKRNIMTKKALKYSDLVILADDNPRYERPETIRKEMMQNLNKSELLRISNIGDRKKAIRYGLKLVKKKDILIIFGKGHEKFQIINGKKKIFSDHDVVKNFLKIR